MNAVAVVPAAGASRRMGRDKLLLPWGQTVVVGSVLDAMRAAGADAVVIVGSPQNRALEVWARDHGQRLVVNPDPDRGMLSSIWAGLEALGGAARLAARGTTLLVSPGDMPGIDSDTVRELIRRVEKGAAVAVPVHDGRRGHPLAISAPLVAEIPALDAAVGLRQLVTRYRDRLVEVPASHDGVVRDLDTPADYAAAVRVCEMADTERR